MKYTKSYLLVVIFLLFGCSFSKADEETKYYQLASALTKLSSAVEATVRYEGIPQDATSNDILLLSTTHDKSLLVPFDGYKLKVHVEGRHAIVLVCKASDNEAYLEDAGCSAELDKHYWNTEAIEPCSSTLNLVQVCNK